MKGRGICGSNTRNCNKEVRDYTVSDGKNKNNKLHLRSLPSHLSSMPSIEKISETEYSTGKFIIQGTTKFPIIFKVIHEKDVLDIKIPVPTGYSKTELTNKINLFGRLTISTNELYIQLLYIYSQVLARYATRYEKEAFRGIGKMLLCFGISYMKDELKLDIDDKSFKLSAQGGIMCENMIGIYPYPAEKIINYYERYYIDDFDIMFYVDSNNLKVLRKGFCMLENEKKLIKYYGSLGFKIYNHKKGLLEITEENVNENIDLRLYNLDYMSVAIRMEAKVSDILRECNRKIKI